MSALDDLTTIIAEGWQGNTNEIVSHTEATIKALFGERYRAASQHSRQLR